MERGYIKLWRKVTDWGWYNNPNTMRLFIHLMLHARHEKGEWNGQKLQRGQIVIGRKTLALKLNTTQSIIRTGLKHLEMTGEIATQPHAQYTVITILNWDMYQGIDQQIARSSPGLRQPLTTNKHYNIKALKNNIYDHSKNNTPKFNLLYVYNLYPRKLGKKKGLEKLSKQIKTQEDYDNLIKAVNNYISLNIKTEDKFIQHFSTFANNWEDYIEIEVKVKNRWT